MAPSLGHDENNGRQASGKAPGLSAYLKEAGLSEAKLARLAKLLREDEGEEPRFEAIRGEARGAGMTKLTKLYLAEEQNILLQAYRAFFEAHNTIQVVGSSSETSSESLIAAAMTFKPDVMLVGVKTLQPATVERLEALRERASDVAVILLSAFYEVPGLKSLREFFRSAPGGYAYLLKHTVDSVEQLSQVVQSVAEGRVILDPKVMEGLISSGEAHGTFLKELSPRELEVLSWMAKGYRNDTIAAVLSRDPKTVERHINSIYSKLEATLDSRHPRVYAVLLYLKAAGILPGDQLREE